MCKMHFMYDFEGFTHVFHPLQSSWEDEDTRKVYSCVDLYFVTQVYNSAGLLL